MPVKSFLNLVARPLEIALGLFFVISAVAKAVDINLFSVQISYYGILESITLLDATAVAVVGLETLLGAALIVGWRLKGLLYPAIALLLAGFTGLVAYAWAFHGLAECGCLGSVEMTPPITISKNIVLLVLTGAAYAGLYRRPDSSRRVARGVAIAATLAVMVYAHSALETIETPVIDAAGQEIGRFANFTIEGPGGEMWNLAEGDYFIVVVTANCPHCRDAVPAVNDLMLEPDMPPAAALIHGDADEIATFEMITQPFFPLHEVTLRTFFSLIGSEPPRFYLVRDGNALKYWDMEPPSAEDVRAAAQ